MPRPAPQNGPKTPMPWLRLWHGFLDNSKVQDVTRVTEVLRARYINLLCVACKANEDGKLPNLDQIAFLLRFDIKTTQKTLDELVSVGLIEKNGKSYCIHDWEHWQFSRSPSAEKQKRYRDRRNAKGNAKGNALPECDVTLSNALPRAHPRVRSEADTDTEGEKKEIQSVAHADSQTLTAVPRVEAPERVTPPLNPPPNGEHPASKAQALLEAKRKAMRASKAKTVGDAAGELIQKLRAESDPDVSQ